MDPYTLFFLIMLVAMTVTLFILFICWKKPVGVAMKVIICTVLAIPSVMIIPAFISQILAWAQDLTPAEPGTIYIETYEGNREDSYNPYHTDDTDNSNGSNGSNGSGMPGDISESPGSGVDYITFLMDDGFYPILDLSPETNFIRISNWLLKLTHDYLLDIENNDLGPLGLADGLTVSSDRLTIDFHLRKSVYFHNGDMLTAHDVVYTYMRWMEAGELRFIKSVSAVDSYTVRFEVEHNDTIYEYLLPENESPIDVMIRFAQYPFLSILNMNATEEDQVMGALIGTGPYCVAEYVPGHYLMLEPNGNYRNGPQGTVPLVFRFAPDAASMDERISILQRGEADMIFGLSIDELDQYYLNYPDELFVSIFPVELRSKEYHGFYGDHYEDGVYGIISTTSFGGIMPTDEIVIGDMHFRVGLDW